MIAEPGRRYLVSVASGKWVVSDMQNYMATVGRHTSFESAMNQAMDLANEIEPPSDPAQSLT
ncbi:MAG: hypothetical protein KJ050_10550 [Candidatus Omnitrophica bacterium]|nr:hypothetical protein [Candidatus Omnitrophota bacterium]